MSRHKDQTYDGSVDFSQIFGYNVVLFFYFIHDFIKLLVQRRRM